MFSIRSKIKGISKRLFSKQLFFSFHIQRQSYNLFYQIDNSIKYIFNNKTFDDILDIFTEDELTKVYISMKVLFIEHNKGEFDSITEKIELDNSTSVYITLIDDISLYNMNYAVTNLFRNKMKLDLKLRYTITMQGAVRDMDLKHFICKSQEQFWKDFHMNIQDTEYERDFRLAIHDLYKASVENKNTHIVRTAEDSSYYFHMACYK